MTYFGKYGIFGFPPGTFMEKLKKLTLNCTAHLQKFIFGFPKGTFIEKKKKKFILIIIWWECKI